MEQVKDHWIDSAEAEEVLSMTCLQLAPMAHLFRELGEPIRCKVEAEQAFMLRKFLGYVRDHGSEWRKVAGAEMSANLEKVKALRAAKENRDV